MNALEINELLRANYKRMYKKEMEKRDWMKLFRNQPYNMAVSLSTNDKTHPNLAKQFLKHFNLRMNRRCHGKGWVEGIEGQDINYFLGASGPGKTGYNYHYHLAFVVPNGKEDKFLQFAKTYWKRIVAKGSSDFTKIYDSEWWYGYIADHLTGEADMTEESVLISSSDFNKHPNPMYSMEVACA